MFTSKFEKIITNLYKEETFSLYNLKSLRCSMTTEDITVLLTQYFNTSSESFYDYQYRFINYVTFYDGMLQPLYYHVEANVTDGINEIHQMMEDMVELGNIWLEKTPWVINNNLTEEMKNITNAIKMPVSLTKYTNFIYNLLSPIETDFLNCVSEFEGIQNNTLFCLFYSAKIFVRTRGSYFIDDNGYNAEGTIYFGFPNYYHTTYGNWRASKLGYTGTRVGHEIGHTFIEHSINPDGLPYFSKPAEDCVQNQYLKTCNEYYEGEVPDACNTSDYTFDDNGADVFGLQLAYAILERDLSDQLREQADGLKITNEQLLFYSFAYRFCRGSKSNTTDGSHSHHNVRINAVAQMPGFQQAFNCASDSRMMKSATKQCVIYGNNAPETRK